MAAEEAADGARNRAGPKRTVEALIGEVLPAVDANDNRHARPDKEGPDVALGAHGQCELRVVEAERLADGVELKSGRGIEGAAAKSVGAAPFDGSFPEGERRRSGDDQRRFDALP